MDVNRDDFTNNLWYHRVCSGGIFMEIVSALKSFIAPNTEFPASNFLSFL